MNVPLPAESQTAKRTHFLPAGSKGMENFFDPNEADEEAEPAQPDNA